MSLELKKKSKLEVPKEIAKQKVVFGRIPPVGVTTVPLKEPVESRWGMITSALYAGPYRVFRCLGCGIAYGVLSPEEPWPMDWSCPECGFGGGE